MCVCLWEGAQVKNEERVGAGPVGQAVKALAVALWAWRGFPGRGAWQEVEGWERGPGRGC